MVVVAGSLAEDSPGVGVDGDDSSDGLEAATGTK